jgi:hypothetical protein
MTLSVMRLLSRLLNFGFYAALEGPTGVRAVVQPLCAALDGRLDRYSSPLANDEYDDQEQAQWARRGRFQLDEHNEALMHVKTEMCRCLARVSDIALNYRVSKMVGFFQQSVKQMDHAKSAKGRAKALLIARKDTAAACTARDAADPAGFFDGELAHGESHWRLAKETVKKVSGLFEGAEGHALDLDAVAPDAELLAVVFDLAMYEEPALFRAAADLLLLRYTQKKRLQEAMEQVRFAHSFHGLLQPRLGLTIAGPVSSCSRSLSRSLPPFLNWPTCHATTRPPAHPPSD